MRRRYHPRVLDGSLRSRASRVARAVDPALWLLAAIGFISQIGISVMLPLLPLYATELGAPPFVLGLLTSLFAITNAAGQLGAGFLSERFGPTPHDDRAASPCMPR